MSSISPTPHRGGVSLTAHQSSDITDDRSLRVNWVFWSTIHDPHAGHSFTQTPVYSTQTHTCYDTCIISCAMCWRHARTCTVDASSIYM
jgi:hypothetical protein